MDASFRLHPFFLYCSSPKSARYAAASFSGQSPMGSSTPPTTSGKLRGAAQDGNWDTVSPLPCTPGSSLRKMATVSY